MTTKSLRLPVFALAAALFATAASASVNGGITCDLPITLKKSGRNHLSGTVGAGGVTIRLDSVNGALSVVTK